MDIFEAIRKRRSVRRYKTDPVDDAKIASILDAGRWAPSWANTQCGRFIVVRDAEVRAKLAATLQNIKLPDREVPNPATRAMGTVPVIIAICAQIGISGAGHGHTGSLNMRPIKATGLCSIPRWRCRIWYWPLMHRGWAR